MPLRVMGTVVDSISARPIWGGSVIALGTQRGSLMGEAGRFGFLLPDTGRYVIRATLPGYLSQTRSLHFSTARTETILFRLHRDPASWVDEVGASPAVFDTTVKY